MAYVTYCAVAVNPDPTCNPFASNSDPNSYGTGPAIAGIFISFLSIVYMATISSRNITAILAQGGITQSALSNVIFGRNSGAAAMPDMKKRLRSSVLFFNLVYVFLAMYLAMIMTNWGLRVKDIGENQPPNSYLTMWMQATAAWITILLYIVALVTPLFDFMPKSVWDFYPRPGTM